MYLGTVVDPAKFFFWGEGGGLTNGETTGLWNGSLKWHFQHSEKTFWKIFRFSKQDVNFQRCISRHAQTGHFEQGLSTGAVEDLDKVLN